MNTEQEMQIIVQGGSPNIYNHVGTVNHFHYPGCSSGVCQQSVVLSSESTAAEHRAAPHIAREWEYFRFCYPNDADLAAFVGKLRQVSNAQQLAHLMVDEVLVQTSLTFDCLVQADYIDHLIPLLSFSKGCSKSNLQAQFRKVNEQRAQRPRP